MAERDQFYSFDEALKELRLKEEELKRLVSEGEIRAFREGDTMKLRRADVESLRSELSGGEVVDLGEVSEELVFEDETEATDDAGMATQEIASVETIIEDDVEDVGEIDIEEEAAPEPAPVEARRPTPRPAPVEVEVSDGALIGAALVGTAILLVLAVPLAMSASTGRASGVARSIASIFGQSV